jgi:hypothetical protein
MAILTLTQEIDRPAADVFRTIPKGVFKLMGPMVTSTGRKNLRATADARKRHLEAGA